jgi:hypothetical protein
MIDAGATSVCAALRAIADWDATDRLPALRCPAVVLTGAAEIVSAVHSLEPNRTG